MKGAARALGALALVVAAGACDCRDPPATVTKEENAQPVGVLAPRDMMRIYEAPGGEVAQIVREAAAREKALGRNLVVYIGATWCEPCQRFHGAAARGELDREFSQVTMLEFDLDHDGQRLAAAGYAPKYIPYFGVPAPDGRAGKGMQGSIKGEGAVDDLTPRLLALLAQ